MSVIEDLFEKFAEREFNEAMGKKKNLGHQTSFSSPWEMEKMNDKRYVDYITDNTKTVAIIYNSMFINYIIKEVSPERLKNIKITFYYDNEFFRKQAEDRIFFAENKPNVEMIYVNNYKSMEKILSENSYDVVFK